jgi:hypothetical protein
VPGAYNTRRSRRVKVSIDPSVQSPNAMRTWSP